MVSRKIVKQITLFILWIFVFPSLLEAKERLRVTPLVYQDDLLSGNLSDLVAAELSQNFEIDVLDRSQVELVFREWTNTAFTENKETQIRLGQLYEVDYFVWLTISTGEKKAVLEIVEAGSSKSVITKNVEIDSADPRSVVKVVKTQVEDLMKTPEALKRLSTSASPTKFGFLTVTTDRAAT